MGQTGMETVEVVRGVVKETKPDLVIAVDALAARNSRRLNRTIQIADTGIHPGSGVGNHRNGITRESIGVPVIGIGVPTVVDAATIVNDTMENLILALESSESLKSVGEVLRSYNAAEKYELIKELIAPHLNGMFVTPKDVDEMVKQISYTDFGSLNLLFSTQKSHKRKICLYKYPRCVGRNRAKDWCGYEERTKPGMDASGSACASGGADRRKRILEGIQI